LGMTLEDEARFLPITNICQSMTSNHW
jgi:hypothetical protein